MVCRDFVSEQTLQLLTDKHLLRSEQNTTGGISYELAHDTLVKPITETAKLRREKEAKKRTKQENAKKLRQAQENAEKQRIEREKERKRQRSFLAVIGSIALIAIIFAISAFVSWQKSEKQKNNITELLKDFLPKNVTGIYQFYIIRADSFYNTGNYKSALRDYKAAELLDFNNIDTQIKEKKTSCEILFTLKNRADSLYFYRNEYISASKIYLQVHTKNKNDYYSKLMFNFSKPLKEQTYVKIRSASFLMGSNDGAYDEKPLHTEQLNEFEISPYEVTNAQYVRFLNEYKRTTVKEGFYKDQPMIKLSGNLFPEKCRIYFKDSMFKVEEGYELHPVIYVTWYGANEFCKFYDVHLLSEAEWEYASKGIISADNDSLSGLIENQTSSNDVLFKQNKYSGTNKDDELSNYAWYSNNSSDGTKQVGLKLPNALGLYDMSGNVHEWCSSCYSNYNVYKSEIINNQKKCKTRVLRGGAWNSPSYYCRTTYREGYRPYYGYYIIGFRIKR